MNTYCNLKIIYIKSQNFLQENLTYSNKPNITTS